MSKDVSIQSLKGFRDILPDDWMYWQFAMDSAEGAALAAGFERMDIPTLERSDLYIRSVGEETDLVGKEMYLFDTSKMGSKIGKKDKKEKDETVLIALRPEFTAGMVRAYIENGMQTWPKPISLYTIGKCFRHDNPQAGRYREFTQFNAEMFGSEDPTIDANLISMLWNVFSRLKLKDLEVSINSIGCREQDCRPKMKKLLADYFKKKETKLCEDCRYRVKKNPFRVLDCKNEKCHSIIASAPLTVDNICDSCKTHFMSVLEYLDDLGVSYNLAPNLVRGLDYYNRTVFEIVTKDDTKRQGALGGGGRYDYLIQQMGGDPTPAIGFALGLDRIVELIRDRAVKIPKPKSRVSVYVIHLGEESKKIALNIMKDLREESISAGIAIGKDSMKAQLKAADKVNALFSIIIGQREAVTNAAIIRDMRDSVQETVDFDDLIKRIKKSVIERIEEEKNDGKKVKAKASK